MNIVKFGQLIGYISVQMGRCPDDYNIQDIAKLIEACVEAKSNEIDVQTLMAEMNNPTGIIPAIKAYRVVTGAGLKEAKDAVEKYYCKQVK